jgi:hypothetical protein
MSNVQYGILAVLGNGLLSVRSSGGVSQRLRAEENRFAVSRAKEMAPGLERRQYVQRATAGRVLRQKRVTILSY